MIEESEGQVPAPSSKRAAQTKYVVLEQLDSKWHLIKKVVARSANAAIREVVGAEGGDPTGTYVAVPERSWNPVKVSVRTQTHLKLT